MSDVGAASVLVWQLSAVPRIGRWEHEDAVDRHRQRIREKSEMMQERIAMVKHPFGTLSDAGLDWIIFCCEEKNSVMNAV